MTHDVAAFLGNVGVVLRCCSLYASPLWAISTGRHMMREKEWVSVCTVKKGNRPMLFVNLHF